MQDNGWDILHCDGSVLSDACSMSRYFYYSGQQESFESLYSETASVNSATSTSTSIDITPILA